MVVFLARFLGKEVRRIAGLCLSSPQIHPSDNMKRICYLFFLLFLSVILHAQTATEVQQDFERRYAEA